MNKKWIVNCYKSNPQWIKNYTDNYIIYDKASELEETESVIHCPNVGYNIYDYCSFIIQHYDNMPDVCVFIKANAFKHCKESTFKILIKQDVLTAIEDYSDVPESYAHRKAQDGGYTEINNSWYIHSHVASYGSEVNRYFKSYNQFLDAMFKNPEHPDYIRFAPGGQYIVPKENILFYSKSFWQKLVGYVDYHQIPSEAHIIERALYYIFSNKWEQNDNI